jgi:hypothetical protein
VLIFRILSTAVAVLARMKASLKTKKQALFSATHQDQPAKCVVSYCKYRHIPGESQLRDEKFSARFRLAFFYDSAQLTLAETEREGDRCGV